jgi:hypothetical protein
LGSAGKCVIGLILGVEAQDDDPHRLYPVCVSFFFALYLYPCPFLVEQSLFLNSGLSVVYTGLSGVISLRDTTTPAAGNSRAGEWGTAGGDIYCFISSDLLSGRNPCT